MVTDANGNGQFDLSEWKSLSGALLDFYNDRLGNPACSDNLSCALPTLEQEYQLITAKCGETKIKRRYRAVDSSINQSNWKEQTVNLTFEQNFMVHFPADWQGNCGDDLPAANLNLDAIGCNVLAWEHEDKRFDGTNSACYTIERTFTVINWCLYVEGEPAMNLQRIEDSNGSNTNGLTVTHQMLEGVGAFKYTQLLQITDHTQPTINIASVEDCLTGLDCSSQKSFSISADDCLGTEGLTYSYTLSENGAILQTGQSTSFAYRVFNKTYQVAWLVQDNCGNTTTKNVTYTFKDCLSPSAFCSDDLVLTLDANSGKVRVWAKDLNQKSTDNCSSQMTS